MSVQGYIEAYARGGVSLAFRNNFARSLKFSLVRREKCSALLVDRHSILKRRFGWRPRGVDKMRLRPANVEALLENLASALGDEIRRCGLSTSEQNQASGTE